MICRFVNEGPTSSLWCERGERQLRAVLVEMLQVAVVVQLDGWRENKRLEALLPFVFEDECYLPQAQQRTKYPLRGFRWKAWAPKP